MDALFWLWMDPYLNIPPSHLINFPSSTPTYPECPSTWALRTSVDKGHILIGSLREEEGDLVESSIDLNTFLGNENGTSCPASASATSYSRQLTYLCWNLNRSVSVGGGVGGYGFTESADNISFKLEGEDEDQVPVLRAMLLNVDGEPIPAEVNLAERIENTNGEFYFG